jgi:hypothetical protein
MVFENQCLICVIWKNLVRRVIKIPVPTRRISMGSPHTNPFTAPLTFVICSMAVTAAIPLPVVNNPDIASSF